MQDNIEVYRDFCLKEKSIPIFSQAWWLDAVVGNDKWDVALAKVDGKIVAALPYVVKSKFGLKILSQPKLTQNLGPWISHGSGKYAASLARQKDLMGVLIDQLPKFDHYLQNWHRDQKNWLPFYWAGFSSAAKYTYVIEDLSNQEKIWGNFQTSIRTDIKKATDRYRLIVRTDLGVEDFLPLNKMVFSRQGKKIPYSDSLVRSIDCACNYRNARKIFIAEDHEGRRHAAVFVIWDENSAYYLLGGGDPALRNSGATSLCMFEAIKFASTVTKCFDFEGSMLEPVERFFRGFGAVQVPYFAISKTPSIPLRLLFSLKASL